MKIPAGEKEVLTYAVIALVFIASVILLISSISNRRSVYERAMRFDSTP